jgi:inner membrane protein
MATPIAHACAGLACLALVHLAAPGRISRPLPWPALACAFAACAPDLDIALSQLIAGNTTALHSGPTHSLGFALLVGVGAWILLPARPSRLALAAALGLAAATHVLIDFLTGPQVGLHRSFGVPVLWPLSDERLASPLTLFRGVKHGGVAIWFTAHNLTTAAIELIFAIPLAVLSVRVLMRPAQTRATTTQFD